MDFEQELKSYSNFPKYSNFFGEYLYNKTGIEDNKLHKTISLQEFW